MFCLLSLDLCVDPLSIGVGSGSDCIMRPWDMDPHHLAGFHIRVSERDMH